jgi:hypothetical protein
MAAGKVTMVVSKQKVANPCEILEENTKVNK